LSETNKYDLFVCSKPLQLLNILNIIQNNNSYQSKLIIVEKFKTKSFQEAMEKNLKKFFSEVIFLEEYYNIPLEINFSVDRLFIDSDFGANKYIIEKIKASKNLVYEEGYGIYRHNYIDSIILKIKYRLKNLSTYIGNCNITDKVIVYRPDVYTLSHKLKSDKKVSSFNISFYENLVFNFDLFREIFNYTGLVENMKGKILLIAETWGFDEFNIVFSQKDLNSYDHIFVKSHPNNYENIKYEFLSSIEHTRIDNPIPIEFIIYELYNMNIETTLIHAGSSSILYMNKFLHKSIDLLSDKDNFKKDYDWINELMQSSDLE
jgi:hypothetical protein